MSHELRAPINVILGFSEMMKIKIFGPLGEKYLGYATNIHSAAIHLLTLVSDVLDTAKIESRQYQVSLELVDINEAAARACGLVAQMAVSKDLAISTHYADGAPKILADRRLVHQTLLNLLSNAIKFTHGGGSADVESDHGGNAVWITRRDMGIGIPADVLPRLCRPFIQASSNHAHQGSGLGLCLAKSFTEMQGGRIHHRKRCWRRNGRARQLANNPRSRTRTRAQRLERPQFSFPLLITPLKQKPRETGAVNSGWFQRRIAPTSDTAGYPDL